MNKYVCGLMFSKDFAKVALIRKNKPEWQKGKLNGIGGGIEEFDENYFYSIVREFKEETGYDTRISDWKYFLKISGMASGNDFTVNFFATKVNFDELTKLKSITEEIVSIEPTYTITPFRADCVENLSWIIGLAIDSLSDNRPAFTTSIYT